MLASESTILTPSLASVKLFFNVVRTFVNLTWEFFDSHRFGNLHGIGRWKRGLLVIQESLTESCIRHTCNAFEPRMATRMVQFSCLTWLHTTKFSLFSLEEKISLKICDRPLSWRAKWALPKWTWWPNYKLFSTWAGVYRDFLSQVSYDHRSYALYDCFLDSVMVSTYRMLGQSLSYLTRMIRKLHMQNMHNCQ